MRCSRCGQIKASGIMAGNQAFSDQLKPGEAFVCWECIHKASNEHRDYGRLP